MEQPAHYWNPIFSSPYQSLASSLGSPDQPSRYRRLEGDPPNLSASPERMYSYVVRSQAVEASAVETGCIITDDI